MGISTDEGAALASANAAVGSGDATALAALNTALAAGGATAKNAAEQIAPQADTIGAGAAASIGSGGAVTTAVSNRLSSVRSGDQYAAATSGLGFSAGSGSEMNKAFWLKPFTNEIDQEDQTVPGLQAAQTVLGLLVSKFLVVLLSEFQSFEVAQYGYLHMFAQVHLQRFLLPGPG